MSDKIVDNSTGVKINEDTASEYGKRGQPKAVEARKSSKSITECLRILLAQKGKPSQEDKIKVLLESGMQPEDIDRKILLLDEAIDNAGKNPAFLKIVLDGTGEMPSTKLDISGSVDIGVGQALSATASLEKLFGGKKED